MPFARSRAIGRAFCGCLGPAKEPQNGSLRRFGGGRQRPKGLSFVYFWHLASFLRKNGVWPNKYALICVNEPNPKHATEQPAVICRYKICAFLSLRQMPRKRLIFDLVVSQIVVV